MPTPKCFRNCPPFPSDVQIANLPIISLTKLENDVANESQTLFEACKEQGFFMLDLRGNVDGKILLSDAEAMFDLITKTFELGHDELLKYKANLPQDVNGYKPPGLVKIQDGTFDDVQMYTISRDDILGVKSSHRDPELFTTHRKQCQEFLIHANGVMDKILTSLDKNLSLASGTLASLAPLDEPSHTTTRMIQASPRLDHDRASIYPGHTDVGIMTMLFHVVGGLQILPFGQENVDANYSFVRPIPGCVLINVGDSLVAWTGGVLRSALHRIVSPPGEQIAATRQSLAYLTRPPHNGSMKRLTSSVIPKLADGEEEDTRSVDEWASWRTAQIIKGEGPVRPSAKSFNSGGIENYTQSVEVA